ncbi:MULTISPECIES: MBL fold metallo-hydrolase [Salinibaculum]|uniref:MBL fold metallo-hydrolase n=1 Tax=Salinibaculum TaxID=2732368 RepID=UPI0030D1532F
MALPGGVYAFSQTVSRDGTDQTFHPSAVETAKGLLLVDVGFPGLTDQVEANLAEAGFDWSDVRGVVLTHQDGDHAGGLADLLERATPTVYAHERCAPYVDGRKSPLKSPDGERYPPADVDVELVDGVSFNTAAGPMDVVFTPGHAPGHVSLHLPEAGLLLAGDALTADADGLQGPNEMYTPDMDEALSSAERLADLDFDRTLCHHGGVVAEGTDRVADIVAAGR